MRRTFLIVIALAVILTIIAIVIALIAGPEGEKLNNNQAANETPVLDKNTNATVVAPGEQNEQAEVLSIARTFAERYGSWSRDSVTAAADELASFVTTEFAGRLNVNHESKSVSGAVMAVTSQALATVVKEWQTETRVKVDVTVDRQEQRSNEPDVEYYKTLSLTLVFQGGRWFVDSADWLPSLIQPGGEGG